LIIDLIPHSSKEVAMEPRKEPKRRFQIDALEERIAPAPVCPIPANENALPSNNAGTLNAVGKILAGPEQSHVALDNWFGKAAC
jgi:hypothetical protein